MVCKATNGRTQTGQEDSNKEKCSIKETNAVMENYKLEHERLLYLVLSR